MGGLPTLRGRQLLAILTREPLNYRIVRQRGSHRTLTSSAWPRIIYAFHDSQEVTGFVVRDVLVNQVGLTDADARSPYMTTTRCTFRIRHESELWYATCDEIPGYVLGFGSLEELRTEIRFGLREVLLIENPEIVEVFEDAAIEA